MQVESPAGFANRLLQRAQPAAPGRYGLLSAKAFRDVLHSAKACRYGLLFTKAFHGVLNSAKACRYGLLFAKASP